MAAILSQSKWVKPMFALYSTVLVIHIKFSMDAQQLTKFSIYGCENIL